MEAYDLYHYRLTHLGVLVGGVVLGTSVAVVDLTFDVVLI